MKLHQPAASGVKSAAISSLSIELPRRVTQETVKRMSRTLRDCGSPCSVGFGRNKTLEIIAVATNAACLPAAANFCVGYLIATQRPKHSAGISCPKINPSVRYVSSRISK